MKKLEGSFKITNWEENPYQDGEGGKQSLAVVTQQYHGSIEGNSEVRYLIAYETIGAPSFVGIETIVGTVDGKKGALVIQHQGKFEDGVASADFTIINATGELAPMVGCGSFKSGEPKQATYQMEVSEQ